MSKRQHIEFYLVGIGNHSKPIINDAILFLIQSTKVFSGGKRHYELVKSMLPKQHTWIEISGRMDSVLLKYGDAHKPIMIFASGDPFFYGFGNTLKRYMPEASIKSFPYFNSIQRLCQKTMIDYSLLRSVSVHGRVWSALDIALIHEEPLIGVLTDNKKTPAAIAARLLKYGFDNYNITVGEELDGDDEKINTYSLKECQLLNHQNLNCVLLERKFVKNSSFGIPDADFIPLPNRLNMITKMPIRLSTLNALQLKNTAVFWDIGACTGSVSIEAKKHFPHLDITAFEKREECSAIIQLNKERFSTPGINVVIDDFFDLDLSEYPTPDVVFIGGHGNRLKEMIHKIYQLNPSTRFVTNAVKETTSTTFVNELTALDYAIDSTSIQLNQHNKITIHAAVKN
ncbi:precorrin-6Y C5,15-methyltransferase (decarboxylating) [Lutibacter agarilyticus]|uniref:Precorrin-6Y C5,15-methyltransferase (Decarboxylating) n=1 Tax=Lutibacter agarilyticus TaxID=1109740 RepID=A0A238WYR3_9FLAO|nr:precorrin-6y C5,15-methyltransferase (decarboxylating) subunit CbiE [Lutibacter agarilyticus]SNR51590.1 precorrin-6Y C5,15-methyltransferase (decarboxylating) [Lutibacter agarilyticus]